MKKAFLPLIALLPMGFFAAPASAAPAPAGVQRADQVLLVRSDRRHSYKRRGHIRNLPPGYRRHHHYRPGHHYRYAPHGWHRYHYRPRDWRTRGCIIVGPIWFCP
jgi:hypothetical protein